MITGEPDTELLDIIVTKVLRVFLLAIHRITVTSSNGLHPLPSHFQSSWLHSKQFTVQPTKPLFICQLELRTRVVEEGDLVVN
jgi:hypothetical protein